LTDDQGKENLFFYIKAISRQLLIVEETPRSAKLEFFRNSKYYLSITIQER